MRDKIIEIMKDIDEQYDYEIINTIVSDKIYDSMMVVNLVLKLSEIFEVEVDYHEIKPENFDSVDRILAFITSLKG